MLKNFNSKTVSDRVAVAALLDLTLLSAVAAAADATARALPNALTGMRFRPTRQRERRSPRQAKVPAPERGRKSHVA